MTDAEIEALLLDYNAVVDEWNRRQTDLAGPTPHIGDDWCRFWSAGPVLGTDTNQWGFVYQGERNVVRLLTLRARVECFKTCWSYERLRLNPRDVLCGWVQPLL